MECLGIVCCLANHRHGDNIVVQSGYVWVDVVELQQAVDIVLFVIHGKLLVALDAVGR